MGAVISILIILVCLFLLLIILVQNPKGGGLSSGFGSANQLGGVRKTTDFLEKATWTFAIALLVLSLASVGFTNVQPVEQKSDLLEYAGDIPQGVQTTPQPPAQGAPQPGAPTNPNN
jgi:preprotein translocase subunit SecG